MVSKVLEVQKMLWQCDKEEQGAVTKEAFLAYFERLCQEKNAKNATAATAATKETQDAKTEVPTLTRNPQPPTSNPQPPTSNPQH